VVLRLTPLVAPIKVTVFPLLSDERLVSRTQGIASELTQAGIFNKVRGRAAVCCLSHHPLRRVAG
jgi:glycyl-tRNA synthetase (class II)